MKIDEIKVAFIKSNRSVKKDDSNTKSKMKSIKDKGILMPVTWVTVERALQEGLEVVDKDDKEVTEGDYKVIIDGQHRIMAAIALSEEKDPTIVDVPLVQYKDELSIMKWLSEVNIQSVAWKGTDFVSGAASMSDDEVVKFAMELKAKGFKTTQISWILTFNEKNITKDDFVDIMNGKPVNWDSKGVNIDTAKAYLEAMKRIEKKMTYSGMFIAINAVCNSRSITKDQAIELISKFGDTDFNIMKERTNKEAASHLQAILSTAALKAYPNNAKKNKKK